MLIQFPLIFRTFQCTQKNAVIDARGLCSPPNVCKNMMTKWKSSCVTGKGLRPTAYLVQAGVPLSWLRGEGVIPILIMAGGGYPILAGRGRGTPLPGVSRLSPKKELGQDFGQHQWVPAGTTILYYDLRQNFGQD